MSTPQQTRCPYQLMGKEYKTNPYPLYAQMRDAGPVHPVDFPSGVRAWLVTGYEAAHAALNDKRFRKNHQHGNDAWRARAAIMPEPQHSQLQVHLLHQDEPKHMHMKKHIVDQMTPRRMESLRPQFQRIADSLIDAMPETGPIELIDSFAGHFPFQVLALVIGLPPHLAARFDRDWGKVVAVVGPTDPGRPAYERRLRELQCYIADVVADRRAARGSDLLSRLVLAHDEHGTLTQEELDSIIFQLLVAGQEPVTNQIATACVTLFQHPDAMRELINDPELLPSAVEELLRYESAFELTTWRFFPEDSDLFGTAVPAGDSVIISLCAANRDPRKFEDADTLDIHRNPNPHMAFGLGSHFCPGASLARIELQIALGTLLRRLPGLRLAIDPKDIAYSPAVLARGVTTLPVTYDERR